MSHQTTRERIKIGVIHTIWNLATWTGLRRLGDITKKVHSGAYGDTIWYFEDNNTNDNNHHESESNSDNNDDNQNKSTQHQHPMDCVIALTIDDGLFSNRGGSDPMVEEIIELLKSYDAQATFMCCTKYTSPKHAQLVVQAGHELGDHLYDDPLPQYYSKMSKEEFRIKLLDSIRYLMNECGIPREELQWFRAPQGMMSKVMKEVLAEEQLINVLGDCYCDDWAFAEFSADHNTEPVAPLMLQQFDRNTGVQNRGSIAIFHMPERGFRETTYDALQEFLKGMQQRNIRCVTVTEMSKLSNFHHPRTTITTTTPSS